MTTPPVITSSVATPPVATPPVSTAPMPAATAGVPRPIVFDGGVHPKSIPDYGALFPVCPQHPAGPDGEGGCAGCDGFALTPKMAFVVAEGLERLWLDLVLEYLEVPYRPDGSVDFSGLRSRALLPPAAQIGRSREWLDRFVACFAQLHARLELGQLPEPQCTGEEMALHLAIGRAEDLLECGDLERWYGNWEEALPSVADYDGDFGWVSEILFEDHDVLLLFDPVTTGVLAPGNLLGELLGVAHLGPDEWFIPFSCR